MYAFWCDLTGEYPSYLAAHTAFALEYFHAASIIVDDLADREASRRDKIALHSKHGGDVAILTSHALVATGYDCLQNSPEPQLLTATWTELYQRACVGQLNDYRRDHRKTIRQQQSCSLDKTAAIFEFAGAAIDTLNCSHSYRPLFRIIGKAFQIGNDLVDLFGIDSSTRHDHECTYPLRLSYLIPELVEAGIVKEEELFTAIAFKRHCQIAEKAKLTLSSPPEILNNHCQALLEEIKTLKINSTPNDMAEEFIKNCFTSSFWLHTHEHSC